MAYKKTIIIISAAAMFAGLRTAESVVLPVTGGSNGCKNGDGARLRSRQLAPASGDLMSTIDGVCCRISAASGSVSRSN